jgi:protein phosphatase
LLKQGKITPEEARNHPHRNILYRALGLKAGLKVDIYPSLALRHGDALLLCSDGLWDMLAPEETLASFVTPETSPLVTCQRMVEAANEAGGEDNITVLLVRVEERDA